MKGGSYLRICGGAGNHEPVGFTTGRNDNGMPVGLTQGNCVTEGVAELGAIAYYQLSGRLRSGKVRLSYRAGVAAGTAEGYSNTVSIDVRGLGVPDGDYRVRHPQDPDGINTVITLRRGRGRILNEIVWEAGSGVPEPATFFPPGGPVTNLFATSGCIHFVPTKMGAIGAIFDQGVEWTVEGNCPANGGGGGSHTFIVRKPLSLIYDVSVGDPTAPSITLVGVDDCTSVAGDQVPADGEGGMRIRQNGCAELELTVNPDGTMSVRFMGYSCNPC